MPKLDSLQRVCFCTRGGVEEALVVTDGGADRIHEGVCAGKEEDRKMYVWMGGRRVRRH